MSFQLGLPSSQLYAIGSTGNESSSWWGQPRTCRRDDVTDVIIRELAKAATPAPNILCLGVVLVC